MSANQPPECPTCGKRRWPVTHSCTGIPPVTAPTRGGADEIREQVARWLFASHAPARYWGSGALDAEEADARSAADELLALPALAPLLALRQRVWNLAEDGGHEGWISARALYDLLDGTP